MENFSGRRRRRGQGNGDKLRKIHYMHVWKCQIIKKMKCLEIFPLQWGKTKIGF